MLTLYASKSTGSVAPQAVLAYTGREHRIVWIDYEAGEHHDAGFLAINPRGQLPAIKLEDDTIITESAAILLHLGDCSPQSSLLAAPGTSARAEQYRWVVFLATNVYEDFLRMAYPHNYTTDSEGEAQVAAAGEAAMDRSWGIVSTALADRTQLIGQQLSVADIYMAMLLSWHRDLDGLNNRYPNLVAAGLHTLEVPEIRAVFDDNGSKLALSHG